MYEVYLEKSAEKDLKGLQARIFQNVVVKIRDLSETPRLPDCRKITGSKSDWRIRVGDFRVIYEIDDKGKSVRVMRGRHRRAAYG